MKIIIVIFFALLSVAYLLNPSAGFLELIPDNFPIIGNLDEAAATALLLSCLAYFGIDLTKIFGRAKKEETKKVDGEVIDVETEREPAGKE